MNRRGASAQLLLRVLIASSWLTSSWACHEKSRSEHSKSAPTHTRKHVARTAARTSDTSRAREVSRTVPQSPPRTTETQRAAETRPTHSSSQSPRPHGPIVRGGSKPNHGVLQALSRRKDWKDVKSWGLVPLDPDTYVGVVAAVDTGDMHEAFAAVAIQRVEGGWQQLWLMNLPTTAKPATVEERGAASIFAKDYDQDGRKEVMVRYRYNSMPEAALGSAVFRDVSILNVTPQGPKLALFANLQRVYGAESPKSWKSRMRFGDVDGDGHPDVILEKRIWWSSEDRKTGEFRKRHRTTQETYLWRPDRDVYERAAPRGGKAPRQ